MSYVSKILHLPLMTLLVLLHSSSAAAGFCSEKYSRTPVIQVAVTGLTTWGAQNIFDCALKCKLTMQKCKALAFVAANKMCYTSAMWNADFSVAAPGSDVFRLTGVQQASPWDVFVQVGNRTFRVIQQRLKGNLSFARNWTDYENGFGDDTDFWLGLRSIRNLTADSPRVFRMEAVTWAGKLYICEYSGFTVSNASTAYAMTFTSYLTSSSNTTSDSLTYHKDRKFSTIDRDNDVSGVNCALEWEGGGGFWFSSCGFANPNGIYRTAAITNGDSNMRWRGADGDNALKSIRLMLQV